MSPLPKLGKQVPWLVRLSLVVGVAILLLGLAVPVVATTSPSPDGVCAPNCHHFNVYCYNGAVSFDGAQICHDQARYLSLPPGSTTAYAVGDGVYHWSSWTAAGYCSIGSVNPTTFTMGDGTCDLTATFVT